MNDGMRKLCRRKETAHDPERTTWFVTHGGGCVIKWACMVASTTGSLLVHDDVTGTAKRNKEKA